MEGAEKMEDIVIYTKGMNFNNSAKRLHASSSSSSARCLRKQTAIYEQQQLHQAGWLAKAYKDEQLLTQNEYYTSQVNPKRSERRYIFMYLSLNCFIFAPSRGLLERCFF